MKVRVVAALCAAVLTVTACGQAGPAQTDGVTLRITWWGNSKRAEATQAALDAYQAANPDIRIEAIPSSFDGYYNKLNTQFASKSAPDIFQDDQVATFADNGLLLNLGDYAEQLNTASVDPEMLKQGTVDGVLYEVPAGMSPMSFVHKGEVLKKAGVEPPTAADTWQDLTAKAAKLKGSVPEGTWPLADSSNQPNHFEVFLRQRGKGWFTPDGTAIGFDATDAAEWLSYWKNMRTDGLVPPADVSTGGSGGDVSQHPVAKDLVSMGIYGTSITLPSAEWSYGPIPNEKPQPGVYKMRSNSWAINANTKHPEEAAKLVNYLINDAAASKELQLTRGVPGSSAALDAIRGDMSPKNAQIVEYADYLSKPGNSGVAPTPDPAGTRELRGDIFTRNAEEVMFDKTDPQTAATNMVQQANDLLAQLK